MLVTPPQTARDGSLPSRGARRSARVGFTLIELLVVISIIALLISILLPALSATRRTARQSVCLSNQRQLAIADSFYLEDNDRTYFWFMAAWPFVLDRYLGNANNGVTIAADRTVNKVFACPADDLNKDGTYIVPYTNGEVVSYAVNRNVVPQGGPDWGYLPEQYVVSPSDTYYRGDMYWSDLGTSIFWMEGVYYDAMKLQMKWHGESTNVLFFDTHAESKQTDDVLVRDFYWSLDKVTP